jgi:nucleoporin SEH1
VWQYPDATRKWAFACDLEKHIGCGVNSVAWSPNMGRSYHLIATAGQDPHQQLKVHRLTRTPDRLVPAGTHALATADQVKTT